MNYGQSYMEQAIEKASKLIELLRKQNQQIRQENCTIKSELQETISQSDLMLQQNQQLRRVQVALKEQIFGKNAQLEQLKKNVSIMQNKIEQKGVKNQRLHQKIAELTSKTQLLSKNCEKQRIKNLSLENQNQYLLKVINNFNQKQNNFKTSQQNIRNQHYRQIQILQRAKNAFSRKWDDLKQQNNRLLKQILIKDQEIIKINQKYDNVLDKFDKLRGIQRQLKRADETITYLIQSTLKVKAQTQFLSKIDQIRNFLGYRLQHIQNLLKSIYQYFDQKGVKTDFVCVKDLEVINSLATCLNSYITQLIK